MAGLPGCTLTVVTCSTATTMAAGCGRHFGIVRTATGSSSSAAKAPVHRKWRNAAEARPKAACAIQAAASRMVAFTISSVTLVLFLLSFQAGLVDEVSDAVQILFR